MNRQETKRAYKQINLEPEFTGANNWTVTSNGVNYKLQVYFKGFSNHFSHGLDLVVDCNCLAGQNGKTCCHANSVLYQYDNRWSLLYPLFNLTKEESLKPIFDKANETYQRLQANSFKAAA